MKQIDPRKEAKVKALLTQFCDEYKVVFKVDGRFLKLPVFVRRPDNKDEFMFNPKVPDSFFDE